MIVRPLHPFNRLVMRLGDIALVGLGGYLIGKGLHMEGRYFFIGFALVRLGLPEYI